MSRVHSLVWKVALGCLSAHHSYEMVVLFRAVGTMVQGDWVAACTVRRAVSGLFSSVCSERCVGGRRGSCFSAIKRGSARPGALGKRANDPEGLHAHVQPASVLQERGGAGPDRAAAAGLRVRSPGNRVQAGHDGPAGRAAALSVLRPVATGRRRRRRRRKQSSPTDPRRAGRTSALSEPSVSTRGGGVPANSFSLAAPRHRVSADSDLFKVSGARLLLSSGGGVRSPSRLLCVGQQRFESGIAHGSRDVAGRTLGLCVGKPSRCISVTRIRFRCWKSTPRCSYCVGFGFCSAENLLWRMCSISGIGCFCTLCPISPRFPISAHRFCWA